LKTNTKKRGAWGRGKLGYPPRPCANLRPGKEERRKKGVILLLLVQRRGTRREGIVPNLDLEGQGKEGAHSPSGLKEGDEKRSLLPSLSTPSAEGGTRNGLS